jgi:hypothetical protein
MPLMMPTPSWSLLEIVGALAVMLIAWLVYRRQQLMSEGLLSSSSLITSPLSSVPLSAVRAPPLDRPGVPEVPPQIKRSLPPTIPLAITQQPSRYGDMFVKWSDDLIKTLFQTDPPRVQGRT